VIGPTPLLDFFKRGEVARDVRLLAAQGALAPRAYEQLAILVLLVGDADPEIRRTADHTLTLIPPAALAAFLARSDVPVGMREFFADRGVFPDEIPPIEQADDPDVPLIDTAPSDQDALEEGDAARTSVVQRIAEMSFTERLKAAMKGSREMRAILIRDTNKMVAAGVLSSPRLSDSEVESFARMTTVGEEVLRTIGHHRSWLKSYAIVVALTKNSKTPVATSMRLMSRLSTRDLTMLSLDRNIPEALRRAARTKVEETTSRK
jgi:hypothetical protein